MKRELTLAIIIKLPTEDVLPSQQYLLFNMLFHYSFINLIALICWHTLTHAISYSVHIG